MYWQHWQKCMLLMSNTTCVREPRRVGEVLGISQCMASGHRAYIVMSVCSELDTAAVLRCLVTLNPHCCGAVCFILRIVYTQQLLTAFEHNYSRSVI